MNFTPPKKPAEYAESELLKAILNATYPINSSLPSERDLAEQLGVTRPTLREALQRLSRDGWLDIQQGKSTRVKDYWKEGSLATLSALAASPHHQSPDFVAYLLEIRLLLAPTYARQALETSSAKVAAYLKNAAHLNGDPAAYASFDWGLHHLLTSYAKNPVYQLLLNGFQELYAQMGWKYFSFEECRTQSQKFYSHLLAIAESMDLDTVEIVMRNTMQGSLDLWLQLGGQA